MSRRSHTKDRVIVNQLLDAAVLRPVACSSQTATAKSAGCASLKGTNSPRIEQILSALNLVEIACEECDAPFGPLTSGVL